jgi:hypothetical protein
VESAVSAGENSGRKLRHDFVVLHLARETLSTRSGNMTATVSLPAKPSGTPVALAAWISPAATEPPLQATGGWLPKR